MVDYSSRAWLAGRSLFALHNAVEQDRLDRHRHRRPLLAVVRSCQLDQLSPALLRTDLSNPSLTSGLCSFSWLGDPDRHAGRARLGSPGRASLRGRSRISVPDQRCDPIQVISSTLGPWLHCRKSCSATMTQYHRLCLIICGSMSTHHTRPLSSPETFAVLSITCATISRRSWRRLTQ